MGTLSRGYTFGATESVTNAKLHSLVDDGAISAIVNADINAGAAIAESKINFAGTTACLLADAQTLTGDKTFSGTTTFSSGVILGTANQGDIWYDDGTDMQRLTPGTSGKYLKTQGAAANPTWDNTGIGAAPEALYQEVQATTTAGGTFTNGAWRTRTLNAEKYNTITGCSLSSNQITLAAGTYYFEASCPAVGCDAHQAVIYNISDSTFDLIGMNSDATAVTEVKSSEHAHVVGRITIAAEKIFELQHRCATTKTTNGFGAANSLGQSEIYSTLRIVQIL